MRRRVGAAIAAAVALGACSGAPGTALQGIDGKLHRPLERAAGAVHVVVFTSHECPIANAYAPTLQALAARFAGKPVRWFLVHVDPDLTLAAAREHAAQYALPGSVLLDPTHALARALHVERTPEAAVLADGGVAYRGRIDDQWRALGARSPAASTHDLRDAIDCALAGRPVAAPTTAVVGCLLPEPRR